MGSVVAAVVGGGVTAATLLGAGVVEPGDGARLGESALSIGGMRTQAGNAPGALSAQEIYRRRSPGVVGVRARAVRTEATPFDVEGRAGETESTGSGIVLDEEGLILTNAHVVASATDIRVTFSADRTVGARPLGKDVDTDLALLRVDAEGLELAPLELGDSDSVRVGDPTLAIGNPLGVERTLSTGVVSARHRRLTAPSGFAVDDVIQTDAALEPGSSGGPLLDAAGRVIGINSRLATGGGAGASVGFAIPVNTAKDVIPQLEQSGRVERAYLGIDGTPLDGGVRIERVHPNSPAAAAGIRAGDVLRALGGRVVHSMEDVSDVLAAEAPGRALAVEVLRAGRPRALTAKLGLRPAALPAE